MKKKKDLHFVSDLDKFSKKFDKTHAPSDAQKAEAAKHERIRALRDNAKKTDHRE
jgi:hypothetical protein